MRGFGGENKVGRLVNEEVPGGYGAQSDGCAFIQFGITVVPDALQLRSEKEQEVTGESQAWDWF